MRYGDYIITDVWFAWYPIKTMNKKIIWLKDVIRHTDQNSVRFLGLLPTRMYGYIK